MDDYIVDHPKLYLMIGGKMQSLPMGSKVSLSGRAAKSLLIKGQIKIATDNEPVVIDDDDDDDDEE